jgi:NADPH:quinone reductase-like Zn-dependent oxidoreductase
MDFGANAEYVCIAQDGLVELKPANVSFEEAATIPYGALTALSLLRRVDIQPGQKVLIVGASGAIGSAALQLAKHYGAEVTGIGGTQRQAYMKALGADHVIDYTKEDFTQNGQTYDLIFDVLGRGSFGRAKRSLNPHGRYFYASFKFKQLFQMMWTSRFGDKKVICAMSSDTQANLTEIKALVEAGKIKTVIDRCYPLEQTADAHRYIEAGQKHASIVISLMPVPMPA